MKKKLISFVSIFLVICTVMSSIPVYAIAESESKLDTPVTNAENKETITNPEFNAANSSKVLNYVDKEEFESHKFIGRLPDEEELNSYVFQNADGSRTAYFLSENVKYVDKDGTIQEKDISLVATRSGYTTTKNDVSVNFSNSPANGITMGYGGHTITLKPVFTTKGVTATKKDNAIEYVGLFSSNATLKYTPLLSGIKEDIVLTKYTGVNEYSFTLITNGLGIYESKNGYFLAESKATKAIFYLGDIIAYDANNVPYEGTLTIKTIKENQEYTLTVSVDEEFLTDENTVYPVTIDPTITISETASGAGAIQDAPIFSARPSSNHGTYEYDRVGTPSADFGVGRTVVRLYGLINSDAYSNASMLDIVSVKFYAREGTGSATQFINLYPLVNTGWTESGVTWNNIGTYRPTSNYGANMASGQLTAFDITNLVIAWKSWTYSANAGFIMMSSNESANKCFVSSEHSDTSKRPYVVMKYKTNIFMLYSVPDNSGGHYHSEQIEDIRYMVDNFSNYTPVVKSTNISPTQCRADLQNCYVFVSRSHGGRSLENGVQKRTFIKLHTRWLYSHELTAYGGDDYIREEDDFSCLGLAVFVAEQTGAGGEGGKNLPTAIVEGGAQAAVGFAGDINCSEAGEWTNTFVGYLLDGYSAEYALERAEALSGIDCAVLCGNKDFVLGD